MERRTVCGEAAHPVSKGSRLREREKTATLTRCRLCARFPRFGFQNTNAKVSIAVDVWVVDGCDEANLGSLEGIFNREVNGQLEATSDVWR